LVARQIPPKNALWSLFVALYSYRTTPENLLRSSAVAKKKGKKKKTKRKGGTGKYKTKKKKKKKKKKQNTKKEGGEKKREQKLRKSPGFRYSPCSGLPRSSVIPAPSMNTILLRHHFDN